MRQTATLTCENGFDDCCLPPGLTPQPAFQSQVRNLILLHDPSNSIGLTIRLDT